jgi:hypothetical protein
MKIKKRLLIEISILCTVLIMTSSIIADIIINPPETPGNFTTAGVYYHNSNGKAYFTTYKRLGFNKIIEDPKYIQFNDTGFYVSSANRINISLVYLNDDIQNAVQDELVLSFYVQTRSETVWFNISGMAIYRNYTIKRNSVMLATVMTDNSGTLAFNNDMWAGDPLIEISQTEAPSVTVLNFQTNKLKRHCVDDLNISAIVTNANAVYLNISTPKASYINESLLENHSIAMNTYWCNRSFSNGWVVGTLHYGYPDPRYGNGTYSATIFAKGPQGVARSSTITFTIYPTADVNMNGYVQPSDINYITSHDWGGNGADHFCASDASGNGHVNPGDINFVTSSVHGWGWKNTP